MHRCKANWTPCVRQMRTMRIAMKNYCMWEVPTLSTTMHAHNYLVGFFHLQQIHRDLGTKYTHIDTYESFVVTLLGSILNLLFSYQPACLPCFPARSPVMKAKHGRYKMKIVRRSSRSFGQSGHLGNNKSRQSMDVISSTMRTGK